MLTLGTTAYLDSPVGGAHDRVWTVVKSYLDDALRTPLFATLDAHLVYAPIIMGEAFIAGYPAKFRLERRARRYSCSPQLDHATFVSGPWDAKVREYVRGLDSAPDALAKLGATEEQVGALRRILAEAPGAVLTAHPVEPPPTAAEIEATRKQQIMDGTIARLQGASGHDFQDAAAAAMARLPPKIREMLARRRPHEEAAAPSPSDASPPQSAEYYDDAEASDATPPAKIAINPDDRHAEFVGRTGDGRQFFLTTPFEPATSVGAHDGREFVALYLFDAEGALLEAQIDHFGPRATMDVERRRAVHDERLRSLGKIAIGRIKVAPFAVERFGTTFGLIPREPDFEAVEMMPGNFMCFFPPWDSGEYDT